VAQVWVVDSSSLIELRNVPVPNRQPVLDGLDAMVDNNTLVYPPQVLGELLRFGPDVAQKWCKKNGTKATRYGPLYDEITPILARVENLIDPSKSGEDQADPYIIAVALRLRDGDGHTPTIITNDTSNKPLHTALSSAAGLFGFPSVPMALFLADMNLYPVA
jgi:hypothetical protein